MSIRFFRLGTALVIAIIAGAVVVSVLRRTGAAAPVEAPASEAARLQREIIDWALTLPSDPELDPLYQQMNARHFGGDLPRMTVRWEPRLSLVDNLPGETGKLKGMFGAKGDRTVIVLSPTLKADANAVRAALAHEMVHAYMFQMGEDTSDHGPAYQAVLRRIAGEGAFAGPLSSDSHLQELRRWIEDERARLRVEEAALNDAPSAERLERHERLLIDRDRLNQEISRYNEMLRYPTGR